MPPGTRLGRFEIIGELGTGGMATVYEGRALSVGGFSRRVAIKYLHPHLLRDEQFVQMFMDEGRLAAQIHHPNVVAVVDLVQEPDRMYLVSEYVEGDQLLSFMKSSREAKTRIPRPVALRVMLDALAGLHAAHELCADDGTALRIVHRDVSPHNILLGVDGVTRITDFGIAKAEERISTTRDGIVKGKLSYMAPEQPDDLPVDRRADIFAAATVLWECLTGARLFPGRTDREVLQALLHKPIPRLRELAPELPSELDEVIARGLARDPDDRYMLAAEFAEAIEAAARPLGVASTRDVALYVEANAARKLGAERERRRKVTTRELPAYRPPEAPLPSVVRTESGLGPNAADAIATVSRGGSSDEAPTMLSAPHVIPRPLGTALMEDGDPEPETLLKLPTPQPVVAIQAPPVPAPTTAAAKPAPTPAAAPAPAPRRKPGVGLAAVVLLLGVVLGYGVWWWMRPTPPVPATISHEALHPRAPERPVEAPVVPVAPVEATPPQPPPPLVVAAPTPPPPAVVRAPVTPRPTPTVTPAPRAPRPRVEAPAAAPAQPAARPAEPPPTTAPAAPRLPTSIE